MLPIVLTITDAGLDALVDAQNGVTDQIEITQVGLSETAVDPAPTVVALAGEFKRLGPVAGTSAAPNIIHMTAQDPSADVYDLRSIALYLADGTLFAVYGQETPLFSKVSIATFLLALDVSFSADIEGGIGFGDASFLYPPATETEKGVAEIATQAEVDNEIDDSRIVTAKKLGTRLAALLAPLTDGLAAEIVARQDGDDVETGARAAADAALQALLDALRALTILGGGLVAGGGDLTANRTLTVTKASGPEVLARALDDRAVTPLGLASLLPEPGFIGSTLVIHIGTLLIQTGSSTLGGNSTGTVTFPVAYTSECFFNANGQNSDFSQEGGVASYANTLTGASVVNSAAASSPYTWLAIGR